MSGGYVAVLARPDPSLEAALLEEARQTGADAVVAVDPSPGRARRVANALARAVVPAARRLPDPLGAHAIRDDLAHDGLLAMPASARIEHVTAPSPAALGPAKVLAHALRDVENLRMARFALVGLSGVLVNLGILILLHERLRLHDLLAVPIAVEASIVWNHFWNDRFTFRDRRRSHYLMRLARFNTVSLAALAVNVAAYTILTRGFGMQYLLAEAVAIVVAFGLNYFGNFHWTYGKDKPRLRPAARRLLPWVPFALVVAAAAGLYFQDLDYVDGMTFDEHYYVVVAYQLRNGVWEDPCWIGAEIDHRPLNYEHPPLAKFIIAASVQAFAKTDAELVGCREQGNAEYRAFQSDLEGEEPWIWRAPAALFGTATVAFAGLAAARLVGWRTTPRFAVVESADIAVASAAPQAAPPVSLPPAAEALDAPPAAVDPVAADAAADHGAAATASGAAAAADPVDADGPAPPAAVDPVAAAHAADPEEADEAAPRDASAAAPADPELRFGAVPATGAADSSIAASPTEATVGPGRFGAGPERARATSLAARPVSAAALAAFAGALLVLSDGTVFTASRMAILDIFAAGFTVAAVFFATFPSTRGRVSSMVSLALGFSCKYSVAFAGPAVLVVALWAQHREHGVTRRWTLRALGGYIGAAAGTWFVLYVPWLRMWSAERGVGYALRHLVDLTLEGLRWQAAGQQTHDYISPPSEWLMLRRPTLIFYNRAVDGDESMVQYIYSIGNPALYWLAVIVFVMAWWPAVWLTIRPRGQRGDLRRWWHAIGRAGQATAVASLLPATVFGAFFLLTRSTYAFYMSLVAPLMAVAVATAIGASWRHRTPWSAWGIPALVLTASWFIHYLPVLSAQVIERVHFDAIMANWPWMRP